MAKQQLSDKYANKAYGHVLMSGANTLTFEQMLFGVGLFEGKALLIHSLGWYPTPTALREIVAATDQLQLALTTSNRLTGITDVAEPAIVAQLSIIGVGVGTEPYVRPLRQDFTSFPGGGLLVPANPLYVGMMTGGFAAAAEARLEMRFTFIDLDSDAYLELLQSLFPANIA